MLERVWLWCQQINGIVFVGMLWHPFLPTTACAQLSAIMKRLKLMHEPPNISEGLLRTCLNYYYALSCATLEFLPNGQNIHAGVYRVVSDQGNPYLLKAQSMALYEPSCQIPNYLQEHGNPFVVAPLPTGMGTLWTQVEDWSVSLYPFIEGNHGWTPPMTDAQWKATGIVLRHIHQTRLPPEGFPTLRREVFDPTAYRQWVSHFEAHHLSKEGTSHAEEELHAAWKTYEVTIHSALTSMDRLADPLRADAGPFVICHADMHPSNLIRDQHGHVFLIDWDDVMLAPKERDFLFVADPPAHPPGHIAPFFLGYGHSDTDWRALAYFRWERVVQDLIEYASDVCFRETLERQRKERLSSTFVCILSRRT